MMPTRGTRHRGSSSHNGARRPPPPAVKKSESFVKAAPLGTAKSLIDKKRQKEMAAATEEYSGAPPAGRGLIEMRLVIPGGRMLPRGLDSPARLDGIRKGFQVWITSLGPNVFSICGDSMPRLREAIRAFNDMIHNLRLASESPSIIRFMVQKPCRHTYTAPIRIGPDSRPVMQLPAYVQTQPRDFSRAIDAHVTNFSTELTSSLEMLTSCTTDLRMRINFGRLSVLQEGLEEQLTLDEFARTIKMNSGRPVAGLDTWLSDPRTASIVFRHLTNPEIGICINPKAVKATYSLTLTVDGQELLLDAFVTPHRTQLSAVRMASIDKSPLLNCTVAAPDMKYDWNLQVNSLDASGDMPSDVADLIRGLSFQISPVQDQDISTPRLHVDELVSWKKRVSETRLKTSRIIPIKETPYVVDISVTTKWKGLMPQPARSETGWQIEMYGIHWDEAVNQLQPGQRRKDWGARMDKIWLETGSRKMEASFREFVQTVLEVQEALDGADPTEI